METGIYSIQTESYPLSDDVRDAIRVERQQRARLLDALDPEVREAVVALDEATIRRMFGAT